MRLFKVLVKLMVLGLVAAAVAGVSMVLRKSPSTPVSQQQWPDVPRNPAAA